MQQQAQGPGHEFDPTTDTVRADPHGLYRSLRARCPVAHSEAYGGFWIATQRADIERITTDPVTFTSRHGIIVPRNPASGRRPPLHFDPPDHTVFRTAINPAFRKDRLRRLEPVLADRARELAEEVAARGHFDGFADLASPLAATTVGHLLNLPEGLFEPMTRHAARFELAQFAFDAEEVERENQVLYRLSRELVAERRANPLDPEEDLVSGLLAVDLTRTELAPGPDTDPGAAAEALEEIVAGSVRQLVVAGHGAPALVLASAIGHLADDPDLQDRVRRRPELLDGVMEELLRLHTPNQGFARTATAEVELGGRTIPAGSLIAIPYTSANRDEAVYDRPDEVVPERSERHLAFGFGVHVCPGAHLGRLQTSLALSALLTATTAIERTGPATWAPFPVHGPSRLPLLAHGTNLPD